MTDFRRGTQQFCINFFSAEKTYFLSSSCFLSRAWCYWDIPWTPRLRDSDAAMTGCDRLKHEARALTFLF